MTQEDSALVTDLISKMVFLFVHAIVNTAFGDLLDAVNLGQLPTTLHALIIFLKSISPTFLIQCPSSS